MIRVLFMGRKPVAAAMLERLHADQRCTVVGVMTDSHLQDSATAKAAAQLEIPVFDYSEVMSRVKSGELTFDIGLSVLYWRKLKRPLIDACRHGIINFHPAPLPEYKGVGGYNLAILDGLDTWAVSAHYVDEEIDTGAIIQVDRFEMDDALETAQTLERKSMARLADLFGAVWEKYAIAPCQLEATPNIGGQYLSRPEMESLKEIDLETDDVERKVRAFWFPPYSGAYIEVRGKKYTLVNDHILQALAPDGVSSLFSKPSTSS